MTANAASVGFQGFRARHVDVECSLRPGLSSFEIKGLPGSLATGAKARILSAFNAVGLALPAQRIVVDMVCAKTMILGPHCDLAIATALLCELELVDRETASEFLFVGQFSNDGGVKPVVGTVLAALHAEEWELSLVVASEQMGVLQHVPNVRIIPVHSCHELISFLKTGRSSEFETNHADVRPLPQLTETSYDPPWNGINLLETEIIAHLKERRER